jgi:hypothetical protein
MNNAETLKISAQGERELVITRVFDGPRSQGYDRLEELLTEMTDRRGD